MNKQQAYTISLSLLLSLIFLLIINNLVSWDLGYKLIIPAIILSLGLIWAFAKPAETEKPGKTKEKKEDKKKPATKTEQKVLWNLFGAVVFFSFLGMFLYFGIPWVNSFGRSAAYMPVPETYPQPSMVGHDYRPPEKTYTWEKELSPEVEYKVFPVSAGQSWKWDYLEDDIEYRVETEGTEPWVLLHKDRV